jgi:ATP-dependent exoDNAse (exonuclease V) alpha subunit
MTSTSTTRPGSRKFVAKDVDELADVALFVIDECSMVDEEIGKDLLSFGVPVLVLGDPAQLPPVKGGGFFTEADPDVMLTEIHRQAAENPIVRMATTIREGGRLEIWGLWRQRGHQAFRSDAGPCHEGGPGPRRA